LVRSYNKKYVEIEEGSWKNYNSGEIMYIYLKKADLTYFFLYDNEQYTSWLPE